MTRGGSAFWPKIGKAVTGHPGTPGRVDLPPKISLFMSNDFKINPKLLIDDTKFNIT